VKPFRLEDFFDEYEHRSGLINLASSDAQPWTATELGQFGIFLGDIEQLTLAYPDMSALLPGLERLCNVPTDFGVLPTSGAAEAIALVMHEYAAASEVATNRALGVPRPSYEAFSGLAALLHLGIERYTYDPMQDWGPNPEELMTLSTRCGALIVINPHNPTGRLIPVDLLAALAEELDSHGGTLIVDEVFLTAGKGKSALGLKPNVIVVGSLSKTHGLPGLRLGWVAGRKDRLPNLRTIQQYLSLTLNAFTRFLKSPADSAGQLSLAPIGRSYVNGLSLIGTSYSSRRLRAERRFASQSLGPLKKMTSLSAS
jgi:histidinol-phosphate/aromatic aminotransferase/cobyric acid decarboxylase-like protein